MRQKSQTRQRGAAKANKYIRRATRKQYSAEHKDTHRAGRIARRETLGRAISVLGLVSSQEFEALRNADVPAWMSEALNSVELEAAIASGDD